MPNEFYRRLRRSIRSPAIAATAAVLGLLWSSAGAAPPQAMSLTGAPGRTRDLVVWAWERPENLAFAGPSVTIAILAGTVTLSGSDVRAVPRLQPAHVLPAQRIVGVVHVEIDRAQRLAWTEAQRTTAAVRILELLADRRFAEVQIDFEVKASQRAVLLDLVHDVRAALPPARRLSMTALASWCDTESWLNEAAADEIVPMLFRMGASGNGLRQRLAEGGDFRLARCRAAIGIATDTLPAGLPPGRRVWLFNPASWTPEALAAVQGKLQE